MNADPPIQWEEISGQTSTPSRSGLARVPGAESIERWEDVAERRFDGAVIVDCGSPDRLHRDPSVPRRALDRCGGLIVIDHHLTTLAAEGSGEGDADRCRGAIRVVDPSRASSSELVWLVIRRASLPVDASIATALLTGIATDTKGFLRDSADARALALASTLRALGGEVSVASDILERHSIGFLRLAGTALSRATVIGRGAGIVASVPNSFSSAGRADDGDIERLTSLLSGTREARVAILLQELSDEIRGSIRTQPPVDAVAIARRFGGGGHVRRAGFRLPGAKLDVAVAEAVTVVREAISLINI